MRQATNMLWPMPACDARYDVLFNDGTGMAVGHERNNRAVVDMDEEREPDEWGEPGRLISAKLAGWWSPTVREISYGLEGGKRMALWIDGKPRLTISRRRYLRWRWIEYDPPIDPEYEDPA